MCQDDVSDEQMFYSKIFWASHICYESKHIPSSVSSEEMTSVSTILTENIAFNRKKDKHKFELQTFYICWVDKKSLIMFITLLLLWNFHSIEHISNGNWLKNVSKWFGTFDVGTCGIWSISSIHRAQNRCKLRVISEYSVFVDDFRWNFSFFCVWRQNDLLSNCRCV